MSFISFNLIYWTPIGGKYFLGRSILEKCGKIWKNGRFSGRLRPDWGNTAWVAMAGLGSIGLKYSSLLLVSEGGALQIMPENFPMGVNVLGVSCPSKKGNCPRGLVVLVGINQRGFCLGG